MQIDITTSMIFSIMGFLLSLISIVLSQFNSHTKETKELEARLTKLELKIEPFWKFVQNEIPKLIIQVNTPELDNLLKEYINGGLKSEHKKERLISLLKEKYNRAKAKEDTGLGFALGIMIISLEQDRNLRGK